MATVKFSDIKERLQRNLQEKLNVSQISHENGFSLIEGFMTLTLQTELSNVLNLGGPNIPIVGVVGNTTGRVYTFALKAILPDIEI